MKIRFKLLFLLALFGSNIIKAQEFNRAEELISAGNEDDAIAILQKTENKNDITYLNLLGEAYMRKGLYDEAFDIFEKAEYLQEQNPDHLALQLADTYSFIAVLHYTTGNNQLSLQYNFKALELRTQEDDEAAIAASTNDIGLVYSQANPEMALEYYNRALTAYRKLYGSSDERVATAYTNIGLAQRNLEEYDHALQNLETALTILRELSGGSVQEAYIHASIGTVYSAQKKDDQALQEFEIALGLYKRNYGDKHPVIASIYNRIGRVYFGQGEFIEALYNFQLALIANVADFDSKELYDNPNLDRYYNPDILLRSLFAKAEAFENLHLSFTLKIKDLEMAYKTIGLCDSLVDKIRQFRSSESDKVALGGLASEIYESAIRISLLMADVKWKRIPYYEKAFYFSDKSKSAVLLEAIADANAKSFAGIPADLLDQERLFKAQVTYYEQKLAGKPTAEEEILYRKELFDWTKNYNELISSLEELYPTYFNLKHNSKIPDVDEIQAKLEENSALISYFVATEDELVYAFIITKDNIKVVEIELDKDYEMNISGYRNAMYYDAPNTYKKTARALYDQLFSFKLSSKINRLVIIPSGRMATIPFEALIGEDIDIKTTSFSDIPYLINDYDISYLYAASLYLNPHVEMPPTATISLFAPVEFKGRRLSTLPGTATEVNDISNLFAGSSSDVSLFIEDKATVSQVKSQAVTHSKYLHFATHGIVDEMRPERSQICLATGEDDMGSLFSGDIYSLNLSADLVVLSACETGLGKISKGEGIIGLTRALIYAGSNNLVVSLWRVGDASTSLLMTDFYRSMLQGNSYAQALSFAKKGMIKSDEYSSPYYWAPFVLIGE